MTPADNAPAEPGERAVYHQVATLLPLLRDLNRDSAAARRHRDAIRRLGDETPWLLTLLLEALRSPTPGATVADMLRETRSQGFHVRRQVPGRGPTEDVARHMASLARRLERCADSADYDQVAADLRAARGVLLSEFVELLLCLRSERHRAEARGEVGPRAPFFARFDR